MKLPSLDKEETKLQMAPMIDMVFLLIIFFMTASHLSSSQSLRLDIPDASKGVVPKERPDRWVVNINRDGSIFSGNRTIDDVDQLRLMVAERVKVDPNVKAYVRADRNTSYKQVRKVMNAMAAAGVGDFIFGVYSKDRKEAEVAP
jgi:biopolymer transport protein ExbD